VSGVRPHLHKSSFPRPVGFDLGLSGRGVFPHVNVFTDKHHAIVRIEAPGVEPEDLKVESEGRTITISGTRNYVVPEGGAFHRRERGTGKFSRSLQLPPEYDPSRGEASYRHGMLTIRIPKREDARPRQISVNAA
jgi:HSP20 family protein